MDHKKTILYYSSERKMFYAKNNHHELPANIFFFSFSVKRKENDSDRKYRLKGGSCRKCISVNNFTDGRKFMILFRLQTLGTGRHIPIFLNF